MSRIFGVIVCMICAFVFACGYYHVFDDRLLIVVCDVGQGDGIIIRTPDHRYTIIDAGTDDFKMAGCIERIIPPWKRYLDAWVLTHAHDDHYGGFSVIGRRFQIGTYVSSGVPNTDVWNAWELKNDLSSIECVVGTESCVNVFSDESVAWNILYPTEDISQKRIADLNDTSVVIEMRYGEHSFLFTGDMTSSVESGLLDAVSEVTVLKVGHHGSKTSSSRDFIEKINPKIALISAGAYSIHGHPHPAIVERLKSTGTRVFETSIEGDVCVWSDGKDLFTGCPRLFSWQPKIFPLQ